MFIVLCFYSFHYKINDTLRASHLCFREQMFLLLEDWCRDQIFFPEESVTRHKVNRIITTYLRWGALTSLTESICHNRVDFILLLGSRNEPNRIDLHIRRGKFASLTFFNELSIITLEKCFIADSVGSVLWPPRKIKLS